MQEFCVRIEYITLVKCQNNIQVNFSLINCGIFPGEVGESLLDDFLTLKDMKPYWEYVGFSYWQAHGMEGVYRRSTFVKDGLLGKVAEFHSDDYIIWTHRGMPDEEMILKEWKAETDVMKHRFLLLSAESGRSPRTKSLWFGFGGYVEVMRYRIGVPVPAKFKDLVFLVDKGLEYAAKGVGVTEIVSEGGEVAAR